MFLNSYALSQKTIKIVDPQGNPIPFVALELNCDENKTQFSNNFEGYFLVPSDCDSTKLKLFHTSYQTKYVKLKEGEWVITMYPKDIKLSELVVTGQYLPTTSDKSVHKVKVIDEKRIKAQGAVNLQELMEQEMNIRVSQDQFLGSSMSIQGLSGENVKILIDGVPIIGRLNGNVDLSQINLNNIERVEIVEGPLSVSYGTNALAGTINLITKKNAEDLSLNFNSYYESVGQYNFDGLASISRGNHSLGLDLGRNYFNGFSEIDSSRTKDWKPKEQWFGGLKYQVVFNNLKLNFTSRLFHEKLTVRGEPRAPYYETAFDEYYYTKRIDNGINLTYNLSKNQLINVIGGYNFYEREKRSFLKDLVNVEYTLLDDPNAQDTSVFDLIFSRGTYSFSNTDSGKVSFQFGYDINYESTRGKRIENKTKEIGDYALFGSMEWQPSKRIIIKPGLRYSHNTEYNSPIIPSFNIKSNITDHLSVRVSYGRGFRAPSLKELHFLFVDLNHNILGNTDLKAELSDNMMLQFTYKRGIKRGVYDFNLSGFYNQVKNQISLALIDPSDQLYTYVNVGEFYSKGINFNSGFRYKTYKTSFGFSYIGRYNLEWEANPSIDKFSYSPEITANFTYEVEEIKTSFNLFYKYSGKLLGYNLDEFDNVTQFEIPDYGMMDFSLMNFFWKKRLTSTVGIKNIFNTINIQSSQLVGGIHSGGGGSIPVSWGRTFFIKLAISLND